MNEAIRQTGRAMGHGWELTDEWEGMSIWREWPTDRVRLYIGNVVTTQITLTLTSEQAKQLRHGLAKAVNPGEKLLTPASG